MVCCSFLWWPATGAVKTKGLGQAEVSSVMLVVQPGGAGAKVKVSRGPHTRSLQE